MPRFSPTLMEHARYPCNQGALKEASLVGKASLSGSPPFISLYLSVREGKVELARFEAAGCGVTTAVCSVTTELIRDKTIAQCQTITSEEICEALEGVPPDKMHCVHVVMLALADAMCNRPTDEHLSGE